MKISFDRFTSLESFEEILKLKRNFQSLLINFSGQRQSFEIKLLLKIASHHGTQIRDLKLCNVVFLSYKDFEDLMKNFSMLEHLNLNDITLDNSVNENLGKVHLSKLKSLDIKNCSTDFYHCFETPQLKSLSLNRIIDREKFIGFLETSESLEALKLNADAFYELFNEKIPTKSQLKLKHIAVEGQKSSDSFEEFLISHKNSVEELKVQFSTTSEKLMKIIFGSLTSLKKLKLCNEVMPYESFFYERLRPSENLRELEVYSGFKSEAAAKGILGNCPNLEVFRTVNDLGNIHSPDLLQFMSTKNPNLIILSVRSVMSENKTKAKFDNLKKLEVERIVDDKKFLEFLKTNATIEILYIKSLSSFDISEGNFKILLNQRNLKCLRIGNEEFKTFGLKKPEQENKSLVIFDKFKLFFQCFMKESK